MVISSKNLKHSQKRDYRKNKPRMSDVVTEYCGDHKLEELVRKCKHTIYKRDQEKLRRRDQALIATLFLTGGRVSEVITLKRRNFDFENEEAKQSNAFLVREMELLKRRTSKGTKKQESRTFPIWYDDPLRKYLESWVKCLQSSDDYLFPTSKPTNKGEKESITSKNVHVILKKIGERLDNKPKINPSWFRFQRQHYLTEKKGCSSNFVQVYLQLKRPPKNIRNTNRKMWQDILAMRRPLKEERIYNKRPYDVLRDIQELFKSARREVKIIDAYVDDSILELYFKVVHPDTKIKLITKKPKDRFEEIARLFKVQKNNFEAKKVKDIHDRYLFIDDKIWVIGSSLNFAGTKPLYLIELNSEKERALKMFNDFWKTGKQIV